MQKSDETELLKLLKQFVAQITVNFVGFVPHNGLLICNFSPTVIFTIAMEIQQQIYFSFFGKYRS